MSVSKYLAGVVMALVASGGANVCLAAAGKEHKQHGHNDASSHGGHAHAPRHGGQVIEVGHQIVELVITAEGFVFHVTGEDEPVDLSGAAFKAIVQTADGVKVLPLKVDGNMLTAKWSGTLPAGSKVALSGKDGHGHSLQARFVTE